MKLFHVLYFFHIISTNTQIFILKNQVQKFKHKFEPEITSSFSHLLTYLLFRKPDLINTHSRQIQLIQLNSYSAYTYYHSPYDSSNDSELV